MTGQASPAGLGETLAQAQESGFFRWFHLTSVDNADPVNAGTSEADQAWCRFRPSGPRFHHLVELALRLDGEDKITAACLGIDRAFISAARIRPFARDITKSYLLWILPADACTALAPEIDSISQFCDGESVVIAHVSWFKQWRGHSRGHLAEVFMGTAASANRRVNKTRIAFENLIEPLPQGVSPSRPGTYCAVPNKDEDAWLCITVAATA